MPVPRKRVKIVAVTNPRKEIGLLGEGIVAGYLRRRGHKILARNYAKPWGELDVVSECKGKLYVSEVKTVSKRPLEYRPEELIHVHKVRRIFRTTMSFLLEKGINEDVAWQLDGYVVVLRKSPEGRVVGGTLKRLPNIAGG